jgi:acetoin utilization deacetylase AcuC-like enzyme
LISLGPISRPAAGRRYGTGAVSLYVAHPSSLAHDTGGHPENAGRLRAIEAALEGAGWPGLERVEAPAATREQLERVHSAEHIDAIEELSANGGGMIDADTVASEGSWEAALHAAGGAAWAAEQLIGGRAAAGFCALRPPGHHAERTRAMGFCLFNNAGVAAAHAIAECGAKRVLVLDWDVHHGNGTEALFAASNEVLYASIHQWPLWPGSGAVGDVGDGDGTGYTINMPVSPGAGPDEFLSLVQQIVVPVGRAFDPGLIIVSAGYDAHRADPLASCMLDEAAYTDMTSSVRDLGAEVGAPILICLEGGYAPAALAASVLATVEAIGSDRAARVAPPEPAAAHLQQVRSHWPGI